MRRHLGSAVVIGGSMSGLCAARVLSDHFEEVTVVERDDLPDQPVARKGVPQAGHVHLLLERGAQILEGWFPGLRSELIEAGAVELDQMRYVRWCWQGLERARFDSTLPILSLSRPLLEHHVRRRTAGLSNVTIVPGAAVEGLVTVEGGAIGGVRLEDGSSRDAQLTIDATGRPGRSLVWLRALGHPEPKVSQVQIDMAYASLQIDHRDLFDNGWKCGFVLGGPPLWRGGVAAPLEGGRTIVTLAGFHGDRPPTDPEGFVAFADSLDDPFLAKVIGRAGELDTIVSYRLASDQRRHFEKLRQHPVGHVFLGDAVVSFDPVYGQGMTSAALQAEVLDRTLRKQSPSDAAFVRAYYEGSAKVVNPLWQMAAGGDFAHPKTTGPKPPGTTFSNWYVERLVRASVTDHDVAQTMAEVFGLLRRPTVLFSPKMLSRALTNRSKHPVPST